MSRLRVESFSLSVDGFGAGPGQSLECPLGVGGEALHRWGERLFSGMDLVELGYRPVEHVATENATHLVLKNT